MGLFRRKTDDPTEREALIAEIAQLRQRLDEADVQKERLHAKLHVVAETNMTIDERVRTLDRAQDELDERLTSLDEARTALDERIAMVTSSNSDLAERVGFIAGLSTKVQDLTDRLTIPPPSVPPPPPPLRDDPRVDELIERLTSVEQRHAVIDGIDLTALVALGDAVSTEDELLADLVSRLEGVSGALAAQHEELTAAKAGLTEMDTMRTEMTQMAEKLSALDSRMRSISFELTNQLTELSDDLEKLLDQSDVDTGRTIDPDQLELALSVQVDEKVGRALGAIHESTERLAAEQARYEIKFREDLAELAERLRRPVLR